MNPIALAKPLAGSLIRSWIPRRRADAHKGDFGHTLVIAGSRGMAGAGVLAAWGALRGGSGLVTLATVTSQQAVAAQRLRPEAMTLPLKETRSGTLSPANVLPILRWMKDRRVTSLVLGPGLSRNPETANMVRQLLKRLDRDPGRLRGIVLDADGFLAAGPHTLRSVHLPIVVTPHPGEFARFTGSVLTGKRGPAASADRISAAAKFAKLYRVVCVLKGSGTIVSDGLRSYVNNTGNPGMARGGSGDVLSGLIGALIGQSGTSLYLLRSACVGVYVHGLAGDLAAARKTKIAMLPGDLAEMLPDAFKKIL